MKFWFERGAWASRKAKAMIRNMQPQDIRRIAVIRHAALGDMVLLRPFLLELRRHFPNAQLTLSLVSHYTYAAPDDLVDRVHIVYGNDRREVSVREQIRRARELGPQDILFDLADTTRAYWLCLLSSAKLKIGFPYRTWQRYVFYDAVVWRSDFIFEADNMLHLLHLFGFKTQHPPVYDLPGEAKPLPRPCVVYFPTASIANKCWPAEKFAALITSMAESFPDQDHLVLQGIAAWETIDPIMQKLRRFSHVSGMKPTSLAESISIIKAATLVVANDTGVRNLAIAAGTPTLGIFFSTVPYRYWPKYGLHEVVFNHDAQPPGVEAVFSAAQTLLQQVMQRR